jgi:hypothetical protein
MISLITNNNPNLTCIEVDDTSWSNSNWDTSLWWFSNDSISSFSQDCNIPCGNTNINEKENSSHIYPNPTSSVINIVNEDTSSEILTELYNLAGELVHKGTDRTLHVELLPTGIYMLKVAYGNKQEIIKVVKE